jgi:hypothetical protein
VAIVTAFAFAAPPTAPLAHAAVAAGTTMPDTIRVDEHLLRLNGIAVYSKLGVRVLVAGLWLEHRDGDAARILRVDAPRRYVTHFLRRVSARRVRDAWMKGLAANTPGATAEVREEFRTLSSWTRDFRAGDEITLTYIPGRGSVVDIGGVRKGVLLGKGFADAYFACAIGPKPALGDKFKRRLLGS